MSEQGRRIHFDPTINLGHVTSAGVSLLAIGAMYGMFSVQMATVIRDQNAQKTEQREATVGVETRLLREITTQRSYVDQTQVRTAEDIRDIKQLMRDGFRDLDAKLDRKADKPGR